MIMRIDKLVIFLFIALAAGLSIKTVDCFAQERGRESGPGTSGSGHSQQPSVQRQSVVQQQPSAQRPDDLNRERASSQGNQTQNRAAQVEPILEIKKVDPENSLYSIEMRNVDLNDFFRVVAHDYKLNILVDSAVQGNITASFNNITLEEALDGIADLSSLVMEKNRNIIKISANLVTRVFVLKHIEAKKLLQGASSGSGGASSSTSSSSQGMGQEGSSGGSGVSSSSGAAESGSEGAQGEQQEGSEGGSSGTSSSTGKANTIFDLLSDKGKILLGQYPNSIMVIDSPSHLKSIEEYLVAIDQKMASRVFKLKYLKATELVGEVVNQTSGSSGSATNSTAAGEAQ